MIGDESSDASSTVRKEVPMMDDDIQLSDISQELVPEDRLEQGTLIFDLLLLVTDMFYNRGLDDYRYHVYQTL